MAMECNALPTDLFPAHYNMVLFKVRKNRHYLGRHAYFKFYSNYISTRGDEGEFLFYKKELQSYTMTIFDYCIGREH